MRYLSRDLADSMKNPAFWAFSGWLNIVVRVRRSRLGVFWLIAPSVVYVWGIALIFGAMLGKTADIYAAHVALGWVVFKILHAVTADTTHCLFSARSFILDGRTRLTDYVLRSLATALFHFMMSLPAVIIAVCIYPHLHMAGVLEGLAAFPLVLVNVLWIGILFSIIGARHPDLSDFIGNIFMFLFLLTPIVWYASSMSAHSLRGILSRMNPFFHLIEIVRAPMLGEPLSMSSWVYVGVMTVVGWLAAVIAYRRYAKFVPVWL